MFHSACSPHEIMVAVRSTGLKYWDYADSTMKNTWGANGEPFNMITDGDIG